MKVSAMILLSILSGIPRAQTVSGSVMNGAGPVAGARITLFSTDTTDFREVRSAAGGSFSFSPVTGSFRLGAAFPGSQYLEMNVTGGQTGIRMNLAPETQPGRWDILINSTPDRLGGTNSAVLMPDGRIVYCHNTLDPFAFNPATGGTSAVQASPRQQGCHAVTLLPDGRAIYAGGHASGVYGPGTRQVKTLNASATGWTVQPDLNGYRWYPSMTQLPDGELLAVGGGNENNPVRSLTSETMDPASMKWTYAGNIAIGNEVSPIALLYTGEVLMTHRPPQLYNPTTRQWRLAADFRQGPRTPDGDHADHDMVLMPDGKAVTIGFKSYAAGMPGNMVEIYDPVANSWRFGSNFTPIRSRPNLTLLPDKKILVMGGYKEEKTAANDTNAWGQVRYADAYDPAADSWRRMADMNVPREYHATPVLVPDGRVIMVAGEGSPGNEPAMSTLEAFTPPYLLRGVRPRILNLPQTTFTRGAVITFDIARANAPTSVVLMSVSANTHFMESGNNRYLELPFTQTGVSITASLPASSVRLPYGFYTLFVMVDDIPSFGVILRVDKPSATAIRPWKQGSSRKSLAPSEVDPVGFLVGRSIFTADGRHLNGLRISQPAYLLVQKIPNKRP